MLKFDNIKSLKMSRSLLLLWFFGLMFSSYTKAQTLEWLNVFDIHGTGAGITPNSIVDNNGKITTVVVEDNVLKLYQTLEDGTITNVYNSNKINQNHYTPLIRVGENQQALVFRTASPSPGSFWLLQTDANLNVTKEEQLELPPEISFPHIQNLIAYDNELYLTTTSNGNHHLLRINDDDSLSVVYNGSIDVAHGEDYILLDNGIIIFSYKRGNGHIIRCVSLESETLIWEQSIDTNHGSLLDYRVEENENILYTIGLERAWVDAAADDKMTISHIDVQTGQVLFQEPLDLPPNCGNCFIGFDDFVYNSSNDHMYISYVSGFPESAILLLEIDNQSGDIINQSFIPHESDLSGIFQKSYIRVNQNGQIVFIYESYKDEIEKGNLYIVYLDDELNPVGEILEINLEVQNSNEIPTQILQYDLNRILITGIAPDPNPSIFWEQVRYFTIMIHLEEILWLENLIGISQDIIFYPNPASDKVNVVVPDDINELTIFDALGKTIHKEKITPKVFNIDVSTYQPGIYFVGFSGQQGWFTKKLIVR